MGCVVSIEHVEQTLGSAVNTVEVDLTQGQIIAQCVPMGLTNKSAYLSGFGSGGTPEICYTSVEIYDNSGTPAVRITRDGSTTLADVTVSVYIVEFNGEINVQTGDTTITTSTAVVFNVTVPAVTLANTFHIVTMSNDWNGSNWKYTDFTSYLTSTTNLRVEHGAGLSFSGHIRWYTVEDTGNNFDVQRFQAADLSGSGTAPYITNTTISAVTMAKTFIIGSETMDDVSPPTVIGPHPKTWKLTTTTNVETESGANGSNYNSYGACEIISLVASDANVIRGGNSMTGTVEAANHTLGVTLGTMSIAHKSHMSIGQTFGVRGTAGAQGDTGSYIGQILLKLDAQRDGIDVERTSNGLNEKFFEYEAIDFGEPYRRLYIT
jgi:hypothetical protein